MLVTFRAVIDSVILSGHPEYYKILLGFLEPVQAADKRWKLCYRATEHSCSAASFHERCDNKGPTVTLVRVNQNVFGGYVDKSWASSKDQYFFSVEGLGNARAHLHPCSA